MKENISAILAIIIVCVAITGFYATTATASNEDIPRMTVDQLKKLLDDPESALIIIDVRTGASWSDSKVMIKSAVREDPSDFNSWAKKHPKEKTFVLYCT